MTQVVPLLALAARRAQKQPTPCSCTSSCGRIEASSMDRLTAVRFEAKMSSTSNFNFGCATLMMWPLCVGLMVLSGVLINNKEIGYNPVEAVKDGSPQHRAVEVYFGEFSSFPAFLCFDDVDVPSSQKDMLELFGSLVAPDQKHTEAFGLNYLTGFYYNLLQTGQLSAFNPPSPSAWRNNVTAPFGTVGLNSTSFYKQYHAWSQVPLENPWQALTPAGMGYISADLAWANEFSFVTANRSLAPALQFSFFSFFVVGLESQEDFVTSIKQANAILQRSPLKGKASIYGATFTFWSVLLDLESSLMRLLGL